MSDKKYFPKLEIVLKKKDFAQYQSHKVVGAAKIMEVRMDLDPENEVIGVASLVLDMPKGETLVFVDQEWVDHFKPEADGYLVMYDDDYMSFSPAEPFEKGYREIPKITKREG